MHNKKINIEKTNRLKKLNNSIFCEYIYELNLTKALTLIQTAIEEELIEDFIDFETSWENRGLAVFTMQEHSTPFKELTYYSVLMRNNNLLIELNKRAGKRGYQHGKVIGTVFVALLERNLKYPMIQTNEFVKDDLIWLVNDINSQIKFRDTESKEELFSVLYKYYPEIAKSEYGITM